MDFMEFKNICAAEGWTAAEGMDGKTIISRNLKNGKRFSITADSNNREKAVFLLAAKKGRYDELTASESVYVNVSLVYLAEKLLGGVKPEISVDKEYAGFENVCKKHGFLVFVRGDKFSLIMTLKNSENYESEEMPLTDKEPYVRFLAENFNENDWALQQIRKLSACGDPKYINVGAIADNARKIKGSLKALSKELDDSPECGSGAESRQQKSEDAVFDIVKRAAVSNGFQVPQKSAGRLYETFIFGRSSHLGAFISFGSAVPKNADFADKLSEISRDLLSDTIENTVRISFASVIHDSSDEFCAEAKKECEKTIQDIHEMASYLQKSSRSGK